MSLRRSHSRPRARVKPAAPSAATTDAAQTLFGMNAPSLGALDEAESALGARAGDRRHVRRLGARAGLPAPNRPRRSTARGAVPIISWEPWDSWRGGSDQPEYALARIAAGDHDALIDRWAAQVADVPAAGDAALRRRR